MNQHPYVEMTHEGKRIEIDEKLAELLAVCWHYGIRTDESCQGGGDCGPEATICFPVVSDMLTFVAACMTGKPSELVERIEMDWSVDCLPIDILNLGRYDYNGGDPDGESQGGHFLCCVSFAPEDIPEVVERLRASCAEIARFGVTNPYLDPAVAVGFARMIGRAPMSSAKKPRTVRQGRLS